MLATLKLMEDIMTLPSLTTTYFVFILLRTGEQCIIFSLRECTKQTKNLWSNSFGERECKLVKIMV